MASLGEVQAPKYSSLLSSVLRRPYVNNNELPQITYRQAQIKFVRWLTHLKFLHKSGQLNVVVSGKDQEEVDLHEHFH